ncbi:MAG: segregation/condensation protein A [Candidatus Marsarchaeota archaeon]|jgi:segregation and condensation protein A|nr:segregation/condensation protein A [Candidatus Marsarchaeota archaeon]
MAMQELTEEAAHGIDVVGLVSKEPTWKELIIELVDKNKLNPWEIDIVQIVDNYMDAVRGMKSLDLKVPANIMLAASILLRMKSTLLVITAPDPEPEEQYYGSSGIESIVVEPLSFRSRLPPKRRVSLEELISALDDAMKIKEQRGIASSFVRPPISFQVGSTDIKADSEKVYNYIKENVDSEKVALFSALAKDKSMRNVMLDLFIPMLYLASENRIALRQDRFFDEIFVRIV